MTFQTIGAVAADIVRKLEDKMNTPNQILFDMRVSRIFGEATEIASHANLLEHLSSVDPLSARYDLKASARNLREAADRLDAIRARK